MCMSMKESNKPFKLEWDKELYIKLVNELADLGEKINKLDKFIRTHESKGYLTEVYVFNMKEQLSSMHQYYKNLENRINLLEDIK